MSKEIYVTVYTRDGKQELTQMEWYNFDDSHIYREGDLHHTEYADGNKRWYKYGKNHRETGPASVWPDGYAIHYLAGKSYSVEDFYKKLREVDELPLTLALIHEEEWVRERAKRRRSE